MPTREATAVWEGNLSKGKGRMRLGSGAFDGFYSFASRFEDAPGTNPEELLGAAHAGCFSMALSLFLQEAGYTSESISTRAKVRIDKSNGGFRISRIELETEAKIPGIDEKAFLEKAEEAKKKCTVSQALAGTDIRLKAHLVGEPSLIQK